MTVVQEFDKQGNTSSEIISLGFRPQKTETWTAGMILFTEIPNKLS